ncbi:MAG TPA: CHRD domain-containing protein [Candidatus Eisenbacteria bacterium]|nr:CHRD domain-containing protein [Candidatus Eisenbacteria bacterium]
MRRLRFLSFLSVLTILSATGAHAQTHWVATLLGSNESPSVSSGAVGQFDATLNDAKNSMTFTLTYTGLVGTMTQANIQLGSSGVNGPIVYWLADGNFPSAITGCTDPSPSGGGCAFNVSDFSDLQAGNLYVNLRTSYAPNGEIRGQITSAVPVKSPTWAKMKAMYR